MAKLKRRRKIAAYWWVGRPNFGDLLTPLLLKHFAEIDATWTPIQEAELVGVGSIIEHIPNGWGGKVVGAGKLHEEALIPVGRNQILGLRGPLTAKGLRGDFAIGDMGLLANELVRIDTKKHALGIVPHWSDTELAFRPEFSRYEPVVIDPRGDPLDVIAEIGACEKIVCSSLHGMILADAFAIPRRFEYTSRFGVEGGVFKFKDYSESIRTPFVVGKTTIANRQAVDDRRSELYDVIRAI